MSVFSDLRERLDALLFRRRREREMDEEMRFHIDREAAEREKEGAAPVEARRVAAAAFGGVERYKEEVREARGTALLEQVVADLRYAMRSLWHNPGFTAAAVLVLGVAIGATGAVFAVTEAVLFSELPYARADRLVRIFNESSPTNRWGLSVADVQAIRDQQRSFSAFGAVTWGTGSLSGAGTPQTVLVGRATPGLFDVLEVPAAAGRLISAGDDAPGAPPVVVITDAIARRSLGSPAAAVGRTVSIDGIGHTVVGVLPPGVNDLAAIRAGVWTPYVMPVPTRRGPFGIRGFARLRDDVTPEAAAADLVGISKRIFPLWSTGFRDSTSRYIAMPLRESIVGNANRQLGLFAGAVVLVLLVAIANVATLLLVRASAREQELAVRVALGAGRGRLARLVASEGVALTLLAGLTGLSLAWASVRLVTAVAPALPRISEVALGLKGVAVVLLLALVGGVLVNLSPVASALAGIGTGAQRGDARRTGTSRRTSVLRGTLVVAEFALALPLLLGAGLLFNSFVRLQQVDPGFDPDGALSVRVTLPAARYPNDTVLQDFWRQALARVEELPILSAVGLMSDLPPDTQGQTNNFNLVDKPVPDGTSEHVAPWSAASPGYFRALGIPLLEGRTFSVADSGTAPPVVIVSQAWAAKYFPGESALGKQLVSGGCYDCPRTTVVGVVGDVKYGGLAGDGEGVYNPVTQASNRSMNVVVRTRAPAAEAFAALRREIGALDPDLPLSETILAERISASLADPRRWSSVLGAFAAAALALAALGIFGLMSYTVRQRRREIGVRLALGAQPATVLRMVVAHGMRLALIGTAIGFALALVEKRWLDALLYGVEPSDPLTIAGSAAVLLLAALGASWLPGWRAARIKPVEAMQTE